MGITAGARFARWSGAGAAAALLACRSEASPERAVALPPAEVSVTGSAAAAAAPAGTRDPTPSAHDAGRAPERFAFDFEDAGLKELVELVGRITGKRFVLSGNLPVVHATAHSPEPVTAGEAWEAFLAILQANGLTVVQRGRLWVVAPSPGVIPPGR